ncbi:MAG: T9SS type A sorting domain-containing protein [Bacteroidetes bacterium]|nr:T9SS type A sorting domain-containing protein [Bacteroidota bacterium]
MKTKKLLHILCFLCLITNVAQSQDWTQVGGGTNNSVGAQCVFNGELYVGGGFTFAGGNPVVYTAKWNGSSWSPVGSNVVGVNFVWCLVIYNDELYAGGSMGIDKWNGTEWVSILGEFESGHIYAMTVYNNELYASGGWPIKKWNGMNWSSIGLANGEIYSMCTYNGELVVAGGFLDIDGIPLNNIAKWNGNNWSPLGIGIIAGWVDALETYNGELYAGGNFTKSQGNIGNYIQKWNGSNWSSLGIDLDGEASELDSIRGKLFVGGGFTKAGSITTNAIATWDGTTWAALGTGMNIAYPYITAITDYKGEIYASGGFTQAGGILALYIAKYNISQGISDPGILTTNVRVIPNPFSTSAIIISTYNKINEKYDLLIYNNSGNILWYSGGTGEGSIKLERKNLNDGLYFFQLIWEDGKRETGKFIIK